MRKDRKLKYLTISIIAAGLYVGGTFFNESFGNFEQKAKASEEKNNEKENDKSNDKNNDAKIVINPAVKTGLEKSFLTSNDWPTEINVQNKNLKIEYNFNENLTGYVKNLLKQYRSDYTTVTIIDNETGKVLSAVGYQGRDNKFDKNLILSSTHPSASLIKVVTAAELLQNTQVKKETQFDFRGRSTTLFKYQLNDSKGRAGKLQTFETAFAKSNNVIFGKAAIKNTTPENLVKMAEGFGFNQAILKECSFLKSEIRKSNDDYSFAELASGYNIDTQISPIHAAMMASVVANDGVMKTPKLISKITDTKTGESLWQESNEEKRVISPETSKEMQDLMAMTIDGGTARKSFRQMRGGYRDALEIGGKTGHITGGTPFGKRDWFAAYAIPREKVGGKGISISVMNVNVKRWHVKSAQLAKSIIEYYYKNVNPIAINNSQPQYESKRVPSSSTEKRKYKRRHHSRKRNA